MYDDMTDVRTYMLSGLARIIFVDDIKQSEQVDHIKVFESMQNIELKDSVMYNEFYKYHPIHAFEKCNDICTCNET